MTRNKRSKLVKLDKEEVVEVLRDQEDFLKPLMEGLVQQVLELEMEMCVGAAKGERSEGRMGYRSGSYPRKLITRVGRLELRVPQDRAGRFSTEVFERYQRSEKALVSALAQMYVEGVSTRKVRAITEELCGHEFSAGAISAVNARMDVELERFARRALTEPMAYLILDARYEKVRETGVVGSQAVLVALGVDFEGHRQVLAVEMANRESVSAWRDFLVRLKDRGLNGVMLAVSDDHPGLRSAIREVLPEACWQRCYVHFLRNAMDYLPRKCRDDCLTELRWLYDRHDVEEARRDLRTWLERWQERYPKLCDWVEANIEETFTFYRLPREHHKHLKSTNMLERFNQELKRRTLVVRIFPDRDSCLRLTRAVAVEIHEGWLEDHRYLNMEALRDMLRSDNSKPMKLPIAA